MAVGVELDLSLGSSFPPGVARVLTKVVVLILIVEGLLERSQYFNICRHYFEEKSSCFMPEKPQNKQTYDVTSVDTRGHVTTAALLKGNMLLNI